MRRFQCIEEPTFSFEDELIIGKIYNTKGRTIIKEDGSYLCNIESVFAENHFVEVEGLPYVEIKEIELTIEEIRNKFEIEDGVVLSIKFY